MNKLLIFFLLAIVTCEQLDTSVEDAFNSIDVEKYLDHYMDNLEFDDLELQLKLFKNIFKGVKNFFKGTVGKAFRKLGKAVQKGINYLKEKNIWDKLVSVVKSVGQVAATSFCSAYLSPAVCAPAVGFVFDVVLKN